jgi:hypothetical protein
MGWGEGIPFYQGAADPAVDGEGLGPPKPQEEDAVGHLLPHPWEGQQAPAQERGGQKGEGL